MAEISNNVPFSPILIMEFVRQVTAAHFLNSENTENLSVKFKLPKQYYDKIKAFPLKAQTIRLNIQYDETSEILTVKADDILLNRFKEQKSQVEIANKYEEQYAERYKKFIEVVE